MIADVKIISIDINGGCYTSVNNSRYWTILILHLFPSHLVTMGINCQINDDDSKV